ncbi:UDP-glucose 4-epimerase [Photobacterium aphoticum]|uniref:UDP-glucose 4-epimerase n=1 Tax=Photobacterium aphoticum TaxID=754436 RepID=A0A090QWE1_9GAMM|nr:UDP-glucose 4-epimerase [Photobacterium aphoticum]
MKSILVTGGCGYIGSHACVALHQAGYQPVILDNLHNSSALVLSRIEALTDTAPIFYLGDIRDSDLLEQIFTQHKIDAVIHFAGLKAVGESVEKPLAYYDNNVNGTLRLVEAMQAHGVNSLIFSSSATVYGDPASVPITENFPTQAMNPYGRSKLMVEECLRDIQHANPAMSITLLRYFNPVGAHESGMMGEDPKGIPNNLMPYIAQVAVGRRSHLSVFGHDYPTVDGTGVRDYIHVVDLVDGHIAALERKGHDAGLHVYNLGTGQGTSVLEMLDAFKVASGRSIDYTFCPRRPGDIAECWAATDKAEQELGWKAKYDVRKMAQDTWHWQIANPQGYEE